MHTFVLTRRSQSEDEETKLLQVSQHLAKQKINGISFDTKPLQVDHETGEAMLLFASIFVDCLKLLKIENTTATDIQHIKELLNDFLAIGGFSTDDFKVSRVDYCHNVRIPNEVVRQRLFDLLQKCPTRAVYTKREHDYSTSIYSKSKSRVLNVYDKTVERRVKFSASHNADNLITAYERDIVRMEMQIKNEHLRYQAKKGFARTFDNWINSDTEAFYLQKFYGMFPRGNFYTLREAEANVAIYATSTKMKERLIEFLRLIARENMDAAKEQYSYNTYHKYINLLGEMNICPITIPVEYGFEYIPSPFVFPEVNINPFAASKNTTA